MQALAPSGYWNRQCFKQALVGRLRRPVCAVVYRNTGTGCSNLAGVCLECANPCRGDTPQTEPTCAQRMADFVALYRPIRPTC
jgi:hypothetical protein